MYQSEESCAQPLNYFTDVSNEQKSYAFIGVKLLSP
jgi:hypothetical protein